MAQKNLNMTPDSVPPYLKLSQYDVGREIKFKLMDGSAEYTVPSGATVTLEGTKPSSLGFTIECSVDGSDVTAVTTAEMTDEWGAVIAELVVRESGKRIGSSNVRFDVERSPHPEGTTDGSAEQIIPVLTQILRQIEEDIKKAEVLSEAEAWAVGQRDGVDVDEEDPAYQNNSKYYAGKAEASKIASQTAEQNASAQALAASGSASEAAASKTASEAAAARSEAASEAAGNVFAQVGNVTFSVMPDGGVREVWTKEE